MNRTRILAVDDDPHIIKLIRGILSDDRYEVLSAGDGAEALRVFGAEHPDVVILDIMMPKMDGIEVCHRLRETLESNVLIIMLTARSEVADKVRCLDMGADGYLGKPFSVNELRAVVRAVLRRTNGTAGAPDPDFVAGDLRIESDSRSVTVAGLEIELTRTEFRLLHLLAANAGKILSYDTILTEIWGHEHAPEPGYLDSLVNHLRQRLESGHAGGRFIATIPGIGYSLVLTCQETPSGPDRTPQEAAGKLWGEPGAWNSLVDRDRMRLRQPVEPDHGKHPGGQHEHDCQAGEASG